MGLESISKAGASQYTGSTPAVQEVNVQAVQGSTMTTDSSTLAAGYAASQAGALLSENDGKMAESAVSLADMKDISKVLNSNTVAEFGFYEPMNRITIKIKDKETGEVLREVPSEKMLKMFTKACELAGILVDEKM